MAIEYGSSPVELAEHQMVIGPLSFFHVLGQQREMMRLAEERRQVGRQRIRERFPLIAHAASFQVVQVADERGDAGRAQAPGQTAVDHLLLAVGQRDAGPLVNHGADPLEVLASEIKFLDRIRFSLRHFIFTSL